MQKRCQRKLAGCCRGGRDTLKRLITEESHADLLSIDLIKHHEPATFGKAK